MSGPSSAPGGGARHYLSCIRRGSAAASSQRQQQQQLIPSLSLYYRHQPALHRVSGLLIFRQEPSWSPSGTGTRNTTQLISSSVSEKVGRCDVISGELIQSEKCYVGSRSVVTTCQKKSETVLWRWIFNSVPRSYNPLQQPLFCQKSEWRRMDIHPRHHLYLQCQWPDRFSVVTWLVEQSSDLKSDSDNQATTTHLGLWTCYMGYLTPDPLVHAHLNVADAQSEVRLVHTSDFSGIRVYTNCF